MSSYSRKSFAPVKVLDNVAVAAVGGVADSAAVDAGVARRGRVVIDASGADCTVSVQTSADVWTTWHGLVAFAAGAVGPEPIFDLCDADVRLHVVNAAAAGAQNVTAWLIRGD